ncbi:MAG TPA: glycosyltransferase [Pyrinomonadaceae bacterium]|nr:glycosyltransferase [Pyrinomonadaceae bacterium]
MKSLKTFLQENLSLSTKLTLKQWLAAGKGRTRRSHLPPRHHDAHSPNHAQANDQRPAILVCDERIPSPDRDAGSLRMYMILKTLAQWSHVVFLPFNRPQGIEYEHALWNIDVETGEIVEYRHLLRNRNFTATILSRPSVGEAMLARIRRSAPGTKIIFDPVDTHFQRLAREYRISGNKKTLRASERYRKLESRLARESDLVWCASTEDKHLMQAAAPGTPIDVVPTIHELHDRVFSFEPRSDLLFVGNMAHSPNADAVHYFMREIYPRIHEALPDVKVKIVGDDPAGELRGYDSPQVSILGYVPMIESFLERSRVFVAPLRFGAGIKGKIGEAMSYGLPVVTTSIGAEGFGLTHGVDVMIADEPSAFADAVVQLYTAKELWDTLANCAWYRIQNNFTPDVIARTINHSIRQLANLNN